MPLYHIQDPDRPAWVMASSYGAALQKYMTAVAIENDMPEADVSEPIGIMHVCDDSEIIVETNWFK